MSIQDLSGHLNQRNIERGIRYGTQKLDPNDPKQRTAKTYADWGLWGLGAASGPIAASGSLAPVTAAMVFAGVGTYGAISEDC